MRAFARTPYRAQRQQPQKARKPTKELELLRQQQARTNLSDQESALQRNLDAVLQKHIRSHSLSGYL